MRAFAACLTVVLGLGAFSVVACSSDAATTTPGGDAGEAGAPSGPAAGGGGASSTAGAPGAGAAGEAGAPATCGYDSAACSDCLTVTCGPQVQACASDSACGGGIAPLRTCACDGTSTLETCEMDFATTGGNLAGDLVTCFNAKCTDACK